MPSLKAVLLLSLALLSACKKEDAAVAAGAEPMADYTIAELASAPAPAPPAIVARSVGIAPVQPGSVAVGIAQRIIIRNASLTLVVKDPEAELGPLGEIASRFGGFLAQSGFSRDGANIASGTVQLRVDAARLDQALAAIRARAIEVRDFNLSSDDVTGEVVDVEARLRNLQSAEAQLHEIMRQAKKTEDVMSVFGQLTQTRGEIEQSQARLKYLRESAALSTVSLSLQSDAANRPVEVAGWQPTGTARRAIESLLQALQGLADLLIWSLIVLLPLGLLLVLPLRALWRRWRKPSA
ncbi:MAG: DUF4349 domain-containing protein [Stagnimonas sp.]|nr:DUF4349 domain-containing protein [Stagnimonas sp.]